MHCNDFDSTLTTNEFSNNLIIPFWDEKIFSHLQVDELTATLNYSKLKFIDYFGTDKQGQHIFAIYACRLPERQELNGHYFIE